MRIGPGLGLSTHSALTSFSPADLVSVAHWYRADAANVTLDGSNNVQQWNDLIGAAHLLQATSANRPAYNAADAAYGLAPTVQSTATNQFMAAASITTTQPFSIWLVGQIGTPGSLIFSLSPGAPYIYSTGVVAMYGGALLSSGVSANTKRAILATFNGASSFLGVDNWKTAGSSGGAGASNGSAIGAFAESDGSFGSVGKLAEIIIQSGAPTSAEKTAMAAYFLARYGIAVA